MIACDRNCILHTTHPVVPYLKKKKTFKLRANRRSLTTVVSLLTNSALTFISQYFVLYDTKTL